jgi:hypothetical protein
MPRRITAFALELAASALSCFLGALTSAESSENAPPMLRKSVALRAPEPSLSGTAWLETKLR